MPSPKLSDFQSAVSHFNISFPKSNIKDLSFLSLTRYIYFWADQNLTLGSGTPRE